jgi:hypothetical protein
LLDKSPGKAYRFLTEFLLGFYYLSEARSSPLGGLQSFRAVHRGSKRFLPPPTPQGVRMSQAVLSLPAANKFAGSEHQNPNVETLDAFRQFLAKATNCQCIYCGHVNEHEYNFCGCCGRTLSTDLDGPPGTMLGFQQDKSWTRKRLYASSFQRARHDFTAQRVARNLMFKAALVLLASIPYYLVCKATIGEEFPYNVMYSLEQTEINLEARFGTFGWEAK